MIDVNKGYKKDGDTALKLTGMPAFIGNASGKAVLIAWNEVKHRRATGKYILVAEATYPNYLPIMLKASGIVTETGGLLSHAAITAREFRIPCVVGVGDATKLIKNGDLVEIKDGGVILVKQK